MTFWDRWLRRPQSLWLRKAIFQIHLWTGIGLGIYVVLISVSGSAIVFRNELYGALSVGPKFVPMSGPRLSRDALKKAIHQALPQYEISYIFDSKRPNEATEVWLDRKGEKHSKTRGRLFDPFTGKDLGPSVSQGILIIAWFSDLHTNLLAGETGRKINGLISILVVLLCISGLVIWWPGMGRVRRGLVIDFKAKWKRLNWDLHTVVGFWTFALVFMWAFTGVYLVFPLPFQKVVNHFSKLELYGLSSSLLSPPEHAVGAQVINVADTNTNPPPPRVRRRRPPIKRSPGDIFIRWFYYLHFGNFAGWQVKALWVFLGLVPVFLFVTGALMWWNRVLSREARAFRGKPAENQPAVTHVA